LPALYCAGKMLYINKKKDVQSSLDVMNQI